MSRLGFLRRIALLAAVATATGHAAALPPALSDYTDKYCSA
jgi:hypothetical protein